MGYFFTSIEGDEWIAGANLLPAEGVRSRESKLMPGVAHTTQALPRAVVIGAGFGGLAAAIRLRARGYAVTLLEAPLGLVSVFRRYSATQRVWALDE